MLQHQEVDCDIKKKKSKRVEILYTNLSWLQHNRDCYINI